MLKECENCHEEKEHHARGLCYTCYKKLKWSPRLLKCKRCKRERPIHAKGLCAGCYNYVFQLDNNKAYRHRKSKGVDLKTYRKTTKSCVLCGFDKIVDLYHIDKNKQNNSPKNLIGLCPNHHRMANTLTFRQEILQNLKEKGFSMPLEQNYPFNKKDLA